MRSSKVVEGNIKMKNHEREIVLVIEALRKHFGNWCSSGFLKVLAYPLAVRKVVGQGQLARENRRSQGTSDGVA